MKDFFKPIAGFGVTFSQIFRRRVTVSYPSEKREKPQRFHGRHVLNRYPDGMEKCIGCELCAGICPARCIYVRGADNPADEPISPGERYGFVYDINMLRCIYCGFCEEVCPEEAIVMSKEYDMTFQHRDEAIFEMDRLLTPKERLKERLEFLEAQRNGQFGEKWDHKKSNNIHTLRNRLDYVKGVEA